jgi:coproporphyrinogen III oxidase
MNNVIEAIDYTLATQEIAIYLQTLQQQICQMLTSVEPNATFIVEPWQHISGGGGITAVLEAGDVIEKAGVNFSAINGKNLPAAATRTHLSLAISGFQAIGLSVIIHPRNPYVPTSHANWRFIVLEAEDTPQCWWFGGGFDLTPYYGFFEDCRYWHQAAAAACRPFGHDVYPDFKQNCDNYFYLQHRQEARGIGGIFYDDLNNLADKRWSFANSFAFMRGSSRQFTSAYQHIINKRLAIPFTAEERAFQAYRRGRYVEFNLLHDRGTLFGLQSLGRIESILVSLPPQVAWLYQRPTTMVNAEQQLQQFLQPRDWLA